MKKRLLSMLMALAMVASFFPTTAFADEPTGFDTSESSMQEVDSSNSATEVDEEEDIPVASISGDMEISIMTAGDWSGTGVVGDPYQITSADDLKLLATNVNDNEITYEGVYFEVTQDIDLEGDAANPWTPIGGSSIDFQGNFDGGGFTISGLYINSSDDYAALFGSIKNATLENFTVQGSVTSSGMRAAGIVATAQDSTLKNLANEATVTNTATGSTAYAAGIAACLYSDASGLVNTGDITISNAVTTNAYAGGLVGYALNSAITITNSYNTGDVTLGATAGNDSYGGGILAYGFNATISYCYNLGDITGFEYVGGICSSSATINNCLNLNATVTGSTCGRIVGVTSSDYTLENNYSWDKTTIGYSGSASTTNSTDASSKNGADLFQNRTDTGLLIDTEKTAFTFDGWSTTYWDTSAFKCDGDVGTSTTMYLPTLTAFADNNYAPSMAFTAAEILWDGEGTSESPYLIKTADDLSELADAVNAGTKYAGTYFEVTENIILSGTWTPIGANTTNYYTYTYTFNGNFDGGGHTISGLAISGSTSSYFVGLFGAIESATIENLVLEGSVASTKSNVYAGALVGMDRGNSTISNIASKVNVTTNNGSGTGGLVGTLNGSSVMSNCYSLGAVSSSSGNNVGGLAGYNSGTIDACYFAGTVYGSMYVGGLVGQGSGAIKNSVVLSSSVSSQYQPTMIGRITGYADGDVTNCYAIETTSVTSNAGDVTVTSSTSGMHGGTLYVDLLKGLFTDEDCTQAFTWDGTVGFDDTDVWTLDEKAIYSTDYVLYDSSYGSYINLPTLWDEDATELTLATAPAGTLADPYRIESAADLVLMQQAINEGTTNTSSTYYVLSNNIDLEGSASNQWTPIGTAYNITFAANFDGQGYTISGLYIDDETTASGSFAYQGLFGYVSGTVQNVTVKGDVTSTGNSVGGVVGYTTKDATLSNITSYVTVEAVDYVGGVVGYSQGTLQYCANYGTVKGAEKVGGIAGYIYMNTDVKYSANHGTISGTNYVGGIAGDMAANRTVSYSYNTGTISGETYIGGLAGALTYGAEVTKSYSTGNVSGTQYVGGIAGGAKEGYGYVNNSVMLAGSVTATTSDAGRIIGGGEGSYTLTNNYGDVNCVVTINEEVATTTDSATGIDGADLYHHVNSGLATVSSGETGVAFTWSDLSFGTTYWSIPESYVSEDESTLYLPEITELMGTDYPQIDLIAEADGSATVPYRISTEAELAKIATDVVGGSDFDGQYFILLNDIALENAWTPIGNSTTAFMGNFDGQGYTISGLKISDEADYQGLFGYTDGATIEKLSVAGTISGGSNVGGLVGYAEGGTTIKNVSSSVEVTGTDKVGGIVGCLDYGSITNAYNTGAITATTGAAGGIAGYSVGSILNVYNIGAINGTTAGGGIVGEELSNLGTITTALSLGDTITGETTGHIVGNSSTSVFTSYGWAGLETSGGEDGDPIYHNFYYGFSTVAENGDAYNWSGFDDFTMPTSYVDDDHTLIYLPTLKTEVTPGTPSIEMTAPGYADFTSDTVEIYTEADLRTLATNVNSGTGYGGVTFTLMNDIPLTETWTPIGQCTSASASYIQDDDKGFRGTFDGQDFTIYDLTIESSANFQGLFGFVFGGTVKNLNVEGEVSGGDYVGGIAGYAKSYNGSGNTITNCTFSGSVTGGDYVGGIVGFDGYSGGEHTGGTLTYCTSNATVKGTDYVGGIAGSAGISIKYSSNTGGVSGSGTVGGIVGSGNGAIGYNYNSGTISGGSNMGGIAGYTISSVYDCYNLGDVTGTGSNVGGILGYTSSTYSSSIEDNYNTGNISGSDYVGGIVGKPTDDDTVSDNVSLGDAITSSGTNVGRIVGSSDAKYMSNNYAYEGMLVNTAKVTADDNISGADLYHNNTHGLTTDADGTTKYDWSSFSSSYWTIPTVVGDASDKTNKILYLPQLTIFYVAGEEGEVGNFPTTTWYVYTVVTSLNLADDVTAPTKNGTPVTSLTDTNNQYTGTIAWKDADGNSVTDKFLGGTVYTATVTLATESDYTFTGVAANSFTYATATSISNAADSGTVTIVFPATADPVLASIAVETEPDTTEYSYGDTFDADGLEITVTYDDGTTADITTGFTVDETTLLTMDDEDVTISYTEGGVTETVDQDITVSEKSVAVDWSVATSYTYTGVALTEPTATIVDAMDTTDTIDLTVTISGTDAFKDAGSYTFTATLKDADSGNYELTSTTNTKNITIAAYDVTTTDSYTYADDVIEGQIAFTEKTFTGVNSETVAGSTAYSYDGTSYDNQTALLTALNEGSVVTSNGETIQVGYTFTPTDSNYSGTITGTITFTVLKIVFSGEMDAETTATYGTAWEDILDFAGNTYVGKVGNDTETGTYTLKIDGETYNTTDTPSVKSSNGTYEWEVTFTSTADTETGLSEYEDIYVASGEVTITPLEVTYTLSDLSYTGSAQVPTVTITNKVNESDSVTITIDNDYAQTNVDTGYNAVLTLNDTSGNYQLTTTATTFDITVEDSKTDASDSDTTVVYGQSIDLKADVAVAASVQSVDAGTSDYVDFYLEAGATDVLLGSAAVDYATDGSGSATLSYNTSDRLLAIGNNTIYAVYNGSVNLNSSNSDTITVELTAKEVTASVTTETITKTYDGKTTATVAWEVASGNLVKSDDEITLSATATYDTANVGTGKTISFTGLTTDGDQKAYYDVSLATGITGAITAKTVTADDITITLDVDSYVYSGNENKPTVTITDDDLDDAVIVSTEYEVVYSNNTDAGTATVTISDVTNGNYTFSGTITKDFTIVQAGGQFDDGVSDVNETEYTYGDTVTVTVNVTSTGEAASVQSLDPATAGQMALYVVTTDTDTGDEIETQLTAGVDATGTEYVLTYDTTDKTLALGEHTLRAKFVENDNLTAVEKDFTITIVTKALTAEPDSVTKEYDGTVDFTDIALKWTNLEEGDAVNAPTATGTSASADAATEIAFTADSVSDLSGTDIGWYTWDAKDVSGNVEITKVVVTETIADTAEINVVVGVGTFPELVFDGIEGETVTGTFNYAGNYYDDYVDILKEKEVGDTVEITYTYVANGNYSGEIIGEIKFTVVTIVFAGNGNAINLSSAPTYGDTWTSIMGYRSSALSATLNDEKVEGTYTLYVDGAEMVGTDKPAAGDHTYQIFFTSTDGNYMAVPVTDGTDTVTVAKRTVAFTWGSLELTYTGGAQAPTAYVTNAVGTDVVYVSITELNMETDVGDYTVSVDLNDETNYVLPEGSGTVDFSIIAASVSGTASIAITTDNGTTGTLDIGDVLTVTATAYPTGGTASYQWYENGVATGTETTYTVTDSEGAVYCEVTYTGNVEGTLTSEEMEISKTALTGTVTVTESEDVLTAAITVEDESATYTIAWYRDGVTITDATEETYTLTDDDLGSIITCMIIASEDYTGTVTSTGYSVAAQAPDAPVITASASSTQITIKWTAPFDGGSAITAYNLYVDGTLIQIPADSTSYTVTGLTNGTSYDFYLVAINDNGYATSETITATPKSSSSSSGSTTVTPEVEEEVEEETEETEDVFPFVDVSESAYYYDAVLWAIENGITTGITDTEFSPTASCTRAQIVTFLWRAAGEPVVTGEHPFTDLDEDAYYYMAVLWAIENGITTGTTSTAFSPDETCTRGQIVTFLWRMDGETQANAEVMDDVNENAFYYDAVKWATSEEITTGYADGTFKPSIDCNRGEIVTFLYRYLGE